MHAHTHCGVLTGMSELRDQRRPPQKKGKERVGFKICRLKSKLYCYILVQNLIHNLKKYGKMLKNVFFFFFEIDVEGQCKKSNR